MNGRDLFLGMNYVNSRYIEEAETVTQLQTEKKNLTLRRQVLVAAIIGLLLLLVGCAAYFYSLQQLVVIDHTKEVIAVVEEDSSKNTSETVPETDAGPVVAEQVLSLQGYEGSPAYLALQEWWEYAIDYTIQNPNLRFSSDYQRPEAYTK